jgi:hypothetical protein
MARDRSLVRASDIGAWAFCQRSWWLSRVKGVKHRDPAVLRRGNMSHARHGQQVVWATRAQQVGAVLILIGLIAIAAGLLWLLAGQ